MTDRPILFSAPMVRALLTYADAGKIVYRQAEASMAGGYRVDTPEAGLYRYRLVSGGHPVAIRIWFGAPLDPVTGEELDRGWRWQATANGAPINLDRVWPACGREPITEAEATYLAGVQAWARENAPNSPQANPRKKIDLLDSNTPLPW